MAESEKERAVVPTDESGREIKGHGTPMFPLQCYIGEVTVHPVNWHWHEEWEIVVCTSGPIQTAAPNTILDLDTGDGVFIGSNVLHEIVGTEPGTLIKSAVFHPRFIAEMDSVIWQKYVQPVMDGAGIMPFSRDVPWQKECVSLLLSCWEYVSKSTSGYELWARDAVSRLSFLMSSNAAPARRETSSRERRESERVKMMMQYIEAHYMDNLTTVQIAGSASVSESECLRCFRNTIHTTPGRYLKDLRMRKAAALLISTDEKVGDIGAACGFLDSAYFTKLFREEKGCTPKEYRRNYQQRS